jgi:hypothetical protein
MMIVSIAEDADWSANNWVFRILAARATDTCLDDEAVLMALAVAQANALLSLDTIDADIARRTAQALLDAAVQERNSGRSEISDDCLTALEALMQTFLAGT